MASLPGKMMVSAIGLALVLAAAAPADAAKARKHKKQVTAPATSAATKSGYRGTNLFRAGPIYNGYDYIGDDPDPFIRLMIQRDMGPRYGGEP
jgi:hypothetical protein